jgi:cytochrome bd-type quinol oxidase subunit 1
MVSMVLVFVGAIFSAMWITTAFAAFYYAVELKEQEILGEGEVI